MKQQFYLKKKFGTDASIYSWKITILWVVDEKINNTKET